MRNTITAISLVVVFVGCSGGADAPPAANFPDAVTIAPLDEALTLARTRTDSGIQLLAVHRMEGGEVTAFNLTEALGAEFTDPITAFNIFGYDTLHARIADGFAQAPETIAAEALTLPVDLTSAHVAAGTNFAAHAEESEVEDGPFLFAKLVEPTPFNAPVSAGDALLDYEVELAFVTLSDTTLPELPQSMGLVLTNDFTNRAALLRNVNPDDVTSGEGFTTGKSAPGYLPVGNLFVIPRHFESFADALELKLAVNGALRQQAPMTLAIWDIRELLRQTEARKDVVWEYKGGEARLPVVNGAIPARTLILAGTPEGTVFNGISRGTMAAGLVRWLAGGWGESVTDRVIERYIASARKQGDYLKPGDTVSIQVERMGRIDTPVTE